MPNSSAVRNIKSSRKKHRCSWCPELILPEESYIRYRYYGYEGVGTVKLHPECYSVMEKSLQTGEEFYPGENPRGCDCGYQPDCEKCELLNNSWYKQQQKRKAFENGFRESRV